MTPRRIQRMQITTLLALVGFAGSALGAVYAAGETRSALALRLTAAEHVGDDHEARLRALEAQRAVQLRMEAKIDAIAAELERIRAALLERGAAQ